MTSCHWQHWQELLKKAKNAFIRQNAILLFIFLVVFCHKTKLPNKGKVTRELPFHQMTAALSLVYWGRVYKHLNSQTLFLLAKTQ